MALRGIPKLAAEGVFELKKNPGEGMCVVRNCKKSGKLIKGKPHFLCHKHLQARWRARRQSEAGFANLRDHAAGRGIPFLISLSYWQGLTDGFAYYDHSAESRGQTLTIDRIHADRPYEPGNLRVITHSENSVKSNKERWLTPHIQAILARKRAQAKKEIVGLDDAYEARLAERGDPF